MRTVSAREANQRFSRLLAEAAAGEQFVITRRGIPVAQLGPARPRKGSRAHAAAVRRMMSLLNRGQDTRDRALELVQASQEAMLALQRRVDERVRAAVEGMSNLAEVRRQLEEIGRRIDELEKRLAELGPKPPGP